MSARTRTAGTSRKPKLGQNFLNSSDAARRIVEALGDTAADTVLEIGPGKGVMTDMMVARTQRLIAVEFDRVLSAQLRLRYARFKNVEVVEGDVLSVDLASLISRKPVEYGQAKPDWEAKAKVIGNLPYYITSDILLRLFDYQQFFTTIVIMVQKEVADRIAARPGSRDYGLLTATTQLFAKVEKLFTLPPGAFSPPPKVYSTVLRLTIAPQSEALGVDSADFLSFLKLAFGQKRKTLVNNLKDKYEPDVIRAALKDAGLRADVRAEAMSLEKAAGVFRTLQEQQRT